MDFLRHKKTQKHIKNTSNCTDFLLTADSQNSTKNHQKNLLELPKVDEKIECEYCLKNFSRQDSLVKHYKICKIKNLEEKNKEKDINYLTGIINILQNELKFNRNITSTAGIIVSQAFKFLEKNCPNAPALESPNLEMITEDNSEIDFVFEIVSLYKRKLLVSFIGDIIFKQYKKEKIEEQSLWSSDVSRMNYIIREVIGKNIEWNNDKSGYKVKSIVIEPLLSKIDEMILNFMRYKTTRIMNHEEDALKNIEFLDTSNEILIAIRDKILEKEIMKYITPKFQISKKIN